MLPAKPESKCLSNSLTFSKESQAIKAVFSLEGFSFKRNTSLVIIPSVPSLPINNCFRSYPVLFLSILFIEEIIVPSASTASSPRIKSLVIPYRITLFPPAFVEAFPPILQEPLAPKSKGKNILFCSDTS